MSLRDSGTKSRKLLRVLAALALALSLLTVTGLVAFAEDATVSVTESEAVPTTGAENEEVSAPTTEEENASEEIKDFKNYPNLDPNASLGDKFMYGLQVAGIGMAVVFLVLIVLMLILYVFKLFATAGAKKPAEAPKAAPAATAAPAPAADDEQTIVAIATAAIAAERGESQCAFKVISITKLQ